VVGGSDDVGVGWSLVVRGSDNVILACREVGVTSSDNVTFISVGGSDVGVSPGLDNSAAVGVVVGSAAVDNSSLATVVEGVAVVDIVSWGGIVTSDG